MAIEKIEKKKVELTKEALLQLIGAGVLVLLSLVLAWFSFTNFRAKSAILAGFQNYAGNRGGEAKRELASALGMRPDHIGVREVLAKMACDQGGAELSVAEEHYRRIADLAREQNIDSTAAKVGMGVVWLKRAEKATAPKEVLDLVGKAQAEFKTATSVPEGEIGLGHCELLLASKLGEAKRMADARAIFEKVRKSLGSKSAAASISRDGLIDFYSGLGRVLASSDKSEDLKDSRDAFQACSQLARRWEVPRSNIMLVEARRWSLWNGTAGEIAAAEPEATLLRRTLGAWKDAKDSALRAAHATPWMLLSVSFAQAQARAGNGAAASAIFMELRNTNAYNDTADPILYESKFRCETALKEGQKPADQDRAISDALGVFEPLFRRLTGADDRSKEMRARSLNNQAVMRSLQGATGYKLAQDHLNEALKLFPDDYVYNRNLALVMKRAKAPAAGMQAALDKAKAAASGKFAEDFEKVQKVIDEK